MPMDRMVWRVKEKNNEDVSRAENSSLDPNG